MGLVERVALRVILDPYGGIKKIDIFIVLGALMIGKKLQNVLPENLFAGKRDSYLFLRYI